MGLTVTLNVDFLSLFNNWRNTLHPVAEHTFTANSAISSTHFTLLSFVDTSEICLQTQVGLLSSWKGTIQFTPKMSTATTAQYSTATVGLYDAHECAVRRQ